MGHITIVRVKNVTDKNKLIDYLKNLKGNSQCIVDRFFLKKSVLTSAGPVYEALEEYLLEGENKYIQ